MQEIRDKVFYPTTFESMKVTAEDSNGYATTTEFYYDNAFTELTFTWTQVWNDSGVCTSWSVEKA